MMRWLYLEGSHAAALVANAIWEDRMRPRRSPRVWEGARNSASMRSWAARMPSSVYVGRGGTSGRGDVRIGWRRGQGSGSTTRTRTFVDWARARGRTKEGKRGARAASGHHVHGVSAVSRAGTLPNHQAFHLRPFRVGEPARLVPSRGRARGCPVVLIFRRGRPRAARSAATASPPRARAGICSTDAWCACNSAVRPHGTWCAAVQASTPRAFQSRRPVSASVGLPPSGSIAERVVDAFPPLDMGEEASPSSRSRRPRVTRSVSLSMGRPRSRSTMRPGSRDPRPPTDVRSPRGAQALIDDDRLLEAARVSRRRSLQPGYPWRGLPRRARDGAQGEPLPARGGAHERASTRSSRTQAPDPSGSSRATGSPRRLHLLPRRSGDLLEAHRPHRIPHLARHAVPLLSVLNEASCTRRVPN